MNTNWEDYSKWLTKEGYQTSTIEATLRNLRAVQEISDIKNLLPHYEAHIKRYLRFVDLSRKNPLGRAFLKRCRKAGIEPSIKRRKHGKRTKDPLAPEDWALLKAKLRKGDEISKLLCAYMMSGVRISTFLRWFIADVRNDALGGEHTAILDKVSRDWISTHSGIDYPSGRATHLYHILCPTERCAYSRMRKRLQELGEELGLDVDFDTLYKSRLSLQ